MSAHLLDGRALGREIRVELGSKAKEFAQRYGHPPGLQTIIAGQDPASQVYVRQIGRACAEVGLTFAAIELPTETTEPTLREHILALNADPLVNGIIVQVPLPKHLSQKIIMDCIAPDKDIDGIHPLNAGNLFLGLPSFVSSTARAVLEILLRSNLPMAGKYAVIVGAGTVGKPLSLLLLQRQATVSLCNSRTTDLAGYCRKADILIVATGKPGLITAEMVKPGSIVLDVGINQVGEKIVGDVDFAPVQEVAGYLTPVPGGVGPLTIPMLLKATIEGAN